MEMRERNRDAYIWSEIIANKRVHVRANIYKYCRQYLEAGYSTSFYKCKNCNLYNYDIITYLNLVQILKA